MKQIGEWLMVVLIFATALSLAVLISAQTKAKPNDSVSIAKPSAFPKIAKIEGPCIQIVERDCFLVEHADNGTGYFTVYSLDDDKKKLAKVEPFDCHHANDTEVDSGGSGKRYWVYRSLKIPGLYASCVGVKQQ